MYISPVEFGRKEAKSTIIFDYVQLIPTLSPSGFIGNSQDLDDIGRKFLKGLPPYQCDKEFKNIYFIGTANLENTKISVKFILQISRTGYKILKNKLLV